MTRGVDFGIQQVTGDNIILGLADIKRNVVNDEDLGELRRVLDELKGVSNAKTNEMIEQILEEIAILKTSIPSTNELEQLFKEQNAEETRNTQLALNGALGELPTKAELNHLIDRLEISTENRNQSATQEILRQIASIIALTDTTRDQLDSITETLNLLHQNQESTIDEIYYRKHPAEGVELISKIKNEWEVDNMTKDELINYYKSIQKARVIFNGKATDLSKVYALTSTQLRSKGEEDVRYIVIEANKIILPLRNLQLIEEPSVPSGKEGKGIRKGRGIAKPKLIIDKVQSEESPHFGTFGNYLINLKQLDKNVFSLKHKGSHRNVDNAVSISSNLAQLIHHIVGGNIPTLKDYSGLTEEEQKYLYKISKKASIAGRLQLPAPKLDAQDEQLREFEKLKGEILAGNDSVELVKKFKHLILKLVNDKMLNKTTAHSLLYELTVAGY